MHRAPFSPGGRGTSPDVTVLAIVAVYASGVLFPFLGRSTLNTHEGFVTVPALQMLESGDFVVPRYVKWTWVEKPPLAIWLTAGVFAATGGFSEAAARFPAAVSGVMLCVVVAFIGLRCFGPCAALFAGLVQASCWYAFRHSRLGEVDLPFTLLIASAHAVLVCRWSRGRRTLGLGNGALFHALAGLAVLTKGPLAVVFLAMTVLGYCAAKRAVWPLKSVLWTPGLICFLLIAVPWHAAAVVRLGEFALERWWYNYLDRFSGEHRLGARPALYYLWTVPYLMVPWTAVLLWNARLLWQRARQSDADAMRFMWAWFLGGLLFLSVASGKHHHYCIPILPALSVLSGVLIAGHVAMLGETGWRAYGAVFVFLAAGYVAVAAAVMPALDQRASTAAFVRDCTDRLPTGATLYLVGLGHWPYYPYVARHYTYLDSFVDVRAQLADEGVDDIWIIGLARDAAEQWAPPLEIVAAEAPRRDHSDDALLVLGRVRRE